MGLNSDYYDTYYTHDDEEVCDLCLSALDEDGYCDYCDYQQEDEDGNLLY